MLIILGILLFLTGGIMVSLFQPLSVWLKLGFLTAFTGVIFYTAGMLGLARDASLIERGVR